MFTFRSNEDGQTMAEYAVILGVIAAVIVLAIGTLSTAISGAITSVAGLM
jgi:Flp pilus assembly pilin Flp